MNRTVKEKLFKINSSIHQCRPSHPFDRVMFIHIFVWKTCLNPEIHSFARRKHIFCHKKCRKINVIMNTFQIHDHPCLSKKTSSRKREKHKRFPFSKPSGQGTVCFFYILYLSIAALFWSIKSSVSLGSHTLTNFTTLATKLIIAKQCNQTVARIWILTFGK